MTSSRVQRAAAAGVEDRVELEQRAKALQAELAAMKASSEEREETLRSEVRELEDAEDVAWEREMELR